MASFGGNMAEYKLKVKIGEHEFEADGPVETVKSQFEAFKDLIVGLPSHKQETVKTTASPETSTQTTPQSGRFDVDRIFRADGRVVSLTATPGSESDAVLLILYGQRHYRENENPTGSQVMDGMEQSGYRTPRIDRILGSLAADGAVIITGAHRGKRYRLTNQGFTRAEGIARETLAKLP
jgi:hypothetical protein